MNVDVRPVACCAPLTSTRLDDDEVNATATLFKSLSDPHRIRMLNLLTNRKEPVCVCEFTIATGLSQPTVSFHLKKLVNAGVLLREQRGTWAYYSIDPNALNTLAALAKPKGAKR